MARASNTPETVTVISPSDPLKKLEDVEDHTKEEGEDGKGDKELNAEYLYLNSFELRHP